MESTPTNMIDLSELTTKELRELEHRIQNEKQTRNELEGWKITFMVRYNPVKNERLTKAKFGIEDLAHFMANEVADLIIKRFNFSMPEDVSGCDIVEATPEEIGW